MSSTSACGILPALLVVFLLFPLPLSLQAQPMSSSEPGMNREQALADLEALVSCRLDRGSVPLADQPLLRLQELRTRYLLAVDDADHIDPARRVLGDLEGTLAPELLSAWSAALRLLDAKHGFWPNERLRLLREGLAELDRLVAAHPRHVEIRYLRLVNTAFLPGILGRTDSTREDRAVLARLLPDAAREYPLRTYDAMVSTVLDLLETDTPDRRQLVAALEEARADRRPLAPGCGGA